MVAVPKYQITMGMVGDVRKRLYAVDAILLTSAFLSVPWTKRMIEWRADANTFA